MEVGDSISIAVQVTGAIIASFVAGSAIFYAIGRDNGKRISAHLIFNKDQTIEAQARSIDQLQVELAKTKTTIFESEKAAAPAPSGTEEDALTRILDKADQDLWLSVPMQDGRHSPERALAADKRILSVVNLKGGVGKTTIALNIAAYFDRLGKRVLVIDADYQGSLSDVLLRGKRESSAKIDEWLTSDAPPGLLVRTANRASGLENTAFVSAFYSFAATETRLMIKWLLRSIKSGGAPDVRFSLNRILLDDQALNEFDLVIFDCPPRLSTGTICALAASTHFLIPSVPDKASLETVPNFTEMVSKLKAVLNPTLKLAGVVATMSTSESLSTREKEALDDMRLDAKHFGEPYVFNRNIPHKSDIAKVAGDRIALQGAPPKVRELFEALGKELATRMGW